MPLHKISIPKRRAWSEEETARFLELRAQDIKLADIATVLGRSYNSVENRSNDFPKKKRASTISDPAENFWSYVDKSGGDSACWPWRGAKTGPGYGVHEFRWPDGKRRDGAHRIALSLAQGRYITDGLDVLHSCDNKPCCNPAHLSEGTKSRNMREAYERNLIQPTGFHGESVHSSKLTLVQVKAIVAAWNIGFRNSEIAELFHVSRAAISHIVAGRAWRKDLGDAALSRRPLARAS